MLTGTGANLGTPHYMAPEQIEKPSEVDHRADIYSLGVVFYEMLTGELPLGRFVPPSEKSATDPRLDDVVLRTLAKEPGRRTQSAGEVKTQIDTIAQTPRSAPVAPAPGKTEDHFWKRFAIVVGLVLLGMMLIPVIAILLSIALPAFHRARTSRPSGQAAPTGASNEGTGRPVAGENTQASAFGQCASRQDDHFDRGDESTQRCFE